MNIVLEEGTAANASFSMAVKEALGAEAPEGIGFSYSGDLGTTGSGTVTLEDGEAYLEVTATVVGYDFGYPAAGTWKITVSVAEPENPVVTGTKVIPVEYRENLFALEKIKLKRITALNKFINADVIAYKANGIYSAINLLIIRNGKMLGSKNYSFESASICDGDALNEFILRYYKPDRLSAPGP